MNANSAIKALESAFEVARQELNAIDVTNGEFNITIRLEGRLDSPLQCKLSVQMEHSHYQTLFVHSVVKGLDWFETLQELTRQLRRQQKLQRLASPQEDSL